MFSDFKFLLNRAVRRSGASPYLETKRVIEHFSECLSEFFNKEVEKSFKILNFREGILEVACLEECDADCLRENSSDLVDKLNQKLDKSIVNDINVLT